MDKLEVILLTEDEQLVELCKLYWSLDDELNFVHKVSELAELFSDSLRNITSTVKKSCKLVVWDWYCEECGAPRLFSSRTDFAKIKNSLETGTYHQLSFMCANCQQKQREIELNNQAEKAGTAKFAKEKGGKEKRNLIREKYNLAKRPLLDISSLSLTEATYLYSVLIGGAHENLTEILSLAMFEYPLTPSQDFTTDIIAEYLYPRNLIYVHPESDANSFDDDCSHFYVWRVNYAPPISEKAPENPTALMQELLGLLNGDWKEEWYQEALLLWKRIALEECKQYLLYVLDRHNLSFKPGEKTDQYLEHALEHFSTGQVINIIWSSAKDAAAYYQRENISKQHAANTAVSSIHQRVERYLANDWNINSSRRDFNCPQTILGKAIYNTVLRLGDDGFNMVPNIEAIKEKRTST